MNDNINKSVLKNRLTKIQINVCRQCLHVKYMKTSICNPKELISK